MGDLFGFPGNPLEEMFNRTLSICLLTVTFSLFVLIFTVVYFSPNLYVTCKFRRIETTVLGIQYSSNLGVERYVGVVSVDEYITDSDSSFLPDVNDIEILDEAIRFLETEIIESGESEKPPDVVESEALTAVKLAIKCKDNFDKAQKLFNHAINLCPNHHEVLLHYGEFLESDNDLIKADHFYLKALIQNPKNIQALTNRRRVLPVVQKLDQEQLCLIDAKRALLESLNKKKDSTMKRLKKEIYFQHIYHTVAIEGNTMSLAETRSVVETQMAVSGKTITEHNEILGVETALRYINQTLANKNGRLTVADILEIHRRILGYVDPVSAGVFRRSQVFVGDHTPPAASDVEVLMDEFEESLHVFVVGNRHPIHIAAFAHHKLVCIHPFLDGNGRTARLLMNLFFVRYGFPPITIRKDERSKYYDMLQLANDGDIRPFYRFIAHCTDITLDEFLHAHEYEETGLEAICSQSVHAIEDIIAL